jgi:hypothetical protein
MPQFKVGDEVKWVDGWTGASHTGEVEKVNETIPPSYDVNADLGYGLTLDEDELTGV